MSTYEFEGLDTSFDVACISLACISLACRTVAYFRGRASTGNENYISHPAQLGVKSSKKHTWRSGFRFRPSFPTFLLLLVCNYYSLRLAQIRAISRIPSVSTEMNVHPDIQCFMPRAWWENCWNRRLMLNVLVGLRELRKFQWKFRRKNNEVFPAVDLDYSDFCLLIKVFFGNESDI